MICLQFFDMYEDIEVDGWVGFFDGINGNELRVLLFWWFGNILVSTIYKIQVIVLKNDFKGLILRTNNDKHYSFLWFGLTPARVLPSCHFYFLLYCCPMNPSHTNMFNLKMHLGVEDRKSLSPFVGHVLSDEWNPYH